MSLSYQDQIKQFVDKYGAENLAVVLGFTTLPLMLIWATTLFFGDPSGAGSLSGVALRLETHHALEPEIKNIVPKEVFEKILRSSEIALGQEKIREIYQMLREIKALDPAEAMDYLEKKSEYFDEKFPEY